MFDIAYEVEVSICVAEMYLLDPISKDDILAPYEILRYVNGLRYWSIMYGTHGV